MGPTIRKCPDSRKLLHHTNQTALKKQGGCCGCWLKKCPFYHKWMNWINRMNWMILSNIKTRKWSLIVREGKVLSSALVCAFQGTRLYEKRHAGASVKQTMALFGGSVWCLSSHPFFIPIVVQCCVKNHQLRFNCFPKKVYNPHHSNPQKVDGSVFPTATATGGSLKQQPPFSHPLREWNFLRKTTKCPNQSSPQSFTNSSFFVNFSKT